MYIYICYIIYTVTIIHIIYLAVYNACNIVTKCSLASVFLELFVVVTSDRIRVVWPPPPDAAATECIFEMRGAQLGRLGLNACTPITDRDIN